MGKRLGLSQHRVKVLRVGVSVIPIKLAVTGLAAPKRKLHNPTQVLFRASSGRYADLRPSGPSSEPLIDLRGIARRGRRALFWFWQTAMSFSRGRFSAVPFSMAASPTADARAATSLQVRRSHASDQVKPSP